MESLLQLSLKQLSRREFLKLSGRALAGLLALSVTGWNTQPGKAAPLPEEALSMGRITAEKIDGYDQPSFASNLKKSYWRDLVLPITGVALGDEESGHNRVWYLLNNESYVHSGDVQPVDIRTNPVANSIPGSGQLVEVTVPFTDTLWDLRRQDWFAYRLYYGTTYWIHEAVQDKNGVPWYRIEDDKWKIDFYVNATHVHIIQPEEVAPISPLVPPEAKRIEIRLPEQIVIAYEYNLPVWMARTATGARFREGDYRTPAGVYITNRKRPSRHMAAGDRAAENSYDLPGVPWVSYLMDNGISFHGTYWHNNFGRPRSHGCINLSSDDARWVYRWTYPSVSLDTMSLIEKTGTMVEIIDQPMGA